MKAWGERIMVITKIGHSCVTVEEDDVRIIIDPGAWTRLPSELPTINAVFISHTHQDHFDAANLERIHDEFPDAPIYTNEEVGEALHEAGISDWHQIDDGDRFDIEGMEVEVHEAPHIEIYGDIPRPLNSTLIFNDRFFFPADAEYVPEEEIELMAAVISAPFWNVSQCAEYIKRVAPKQIINIHDALLAPGKEGIFHEVATKAIEEVAGDIILLENGKSVEL